jgi:hypothetical protein
MRRPVVTERRHRENAVLRERFRELEERWNRVHPPMALDDLLATGRANGDQHLIKPLNDGRTVLETYRPNILLIGPQPTVRHVLQITLRSAVRPVVTCSARSFTLPDPPVGTLVLCDAEFLNRVAQRRLYAWLLRTSSHPQVITTASVPLFPLVIRNAFDDALFYRLNTVALRLGPPSADS